MGTTISFENGTRNENNVRHSYCCNDSNYNLSTHAMRKIRKDEMEEFERLTTEFLKDYCKGRQDEFLLFDYPSEGGELKIKVDLTLPSSVYTVFCRFSDWKMSKAIYPWLYGTGKYNFHTSASSGQEAFNQFKNHLTPVL